MNQTNMRAATFEEAVSFTEGKGQAVNINITTQDQVAHFCQSRRQTTVQLYEYLHESGQELVRLKYGTCDNCAEVYVNLKI